MAVMEPQLVLFGRTPPRQQFLKWIGNKQRFASTIAECLPLGYNRYIEPFVGSGAVLATVTPESGIAGDNLAPLIEIWQLLQSSPNRLLEHYTTLHAEYLLNPKEVYNRVLGHYNTCPNGPDLLFLCRCCYGGVIRFTRNGYMSTPLGPHRAIAPKALAERITAWRPRIANTEFICADFEVTMDFARQGDVVYCDPPYVYSQSILYGSQEFSLERLWRAIDMCRGRDAKVVLSLDGMKKSGQIYTLIDLPEGLFERELLVDCGRSMLRRFQKRGNCMRGEQVHDRLLLTW